VAVSHTARSPSGGTTQGRDWAAIASDAGLVVLEVAPVMNSEGTGPVNEFASADPTFADLEEVDDFLAQRRRSHAASADGVSANLRWGDDGRLAFNSKPVIG
jgi:esterase